jgi:hypothetical protein
MLRRAQWKIILPVVQLVITLSLSVVGSAQSAQRLKAGATAWDYLAPAEVILHSINYPAAVATGLTVAHRTFQIGIEYSHGFFCLYVLYVLLFWCGLGWCIDRLSSASHARRDVPVSVAVIGMISGAILLLAAIGTMRGPYALLLVFSAFAWSGVFLVCSAAILVMQHRGARSRRAA